MTEPGASREDGTTDETVPHQAEIRDASDAPTVETAVTVEVAATDGSGAPRLRSGGSGPLRRGETRVPDALLALDLDDARSGSGPVPVDAEVPADMNPPTVDGVVRAVHARLARSRKWRTVTRDQVQNTMEALDLDLGLPARATPRLQVTRLRFTGTKTRHDEPPAPISYDQTFQSGVNVLHVPKNLCGKSTIFQLIRFALTGDSSGIAADVRPWITHLWLHFTLGDAQYTVHLDQSSGALRGFIAASHEAPLLTELETSAVATVARFEDADQAKTRLQEFFLDQLHLVRLGWTHTQDGVTDERFISWHTYWQALAVPDRSEDYLMVSERNSTGNQQGLLLSMLLGLRFAQPLNDLLLERRKLESDIQSTTEGRNAAVASRDAAAASVAAVEADLERLTAALRARRAVLDEPANARELHTMLRDHEVRLAELREQRRRRDDLSQAIQRERARARSLRETADLRLHFTGLAVSLCPNCDEDVAPEAVVREQTQHDCRLCGKAARPAASEEIDALRDEASLKDAQVEVLAAQRDELSQLARANEDLVNSEAGQIDALRERLRRGAEAVLPTADELAARDELLLRLGAARSALAQTTVAVQRMMGTNDDAPLRTVVVQHAREVLRDAAERLNATVLAELNRLVQELVASLGADSITAVHCSALGALTLQKHAAKVSFGAVTAPGERLRIKLAFYLAMMRLGRIQGHGRHPGFLMIDQPGSDEMIDENFIRLATILRGIDEQFHDETQVICFTARPQFAAATAPTKVYGAQAGEWVF